MTKLLTRLLLTTVAPAFVWSVLACTSTATAQQLEVSITMAKAEFRQIEPVDLTFTLKNLSDRAIRVLEWNTPIEGFIIGNPFVVTLTGVPRRYIGIYATRRGPQPDNYVMIEPHGTVSRTVDLSVSYDLRAAGRYEVQIRRPVLFDVRRAEERLPKRAKQFKSANYRVVSPATFRLLDDGIPLPPPTTPLARTPVPASASPLSTPNCNAGETASLTQAYGQLSNDASALSSSATTVFASCGSNYTGLANSYFGACGSAGLSGVTNVFTGINNYANGTGTVTADCGDSCGGGSPCSNTGIFAYTCGPPTMYICPMMFTYPTVSVPAGGEGPYTIEWVMYHELSHWMGTEDTAYGCFNAQQLATNNQAEADNNAENFEDYGATLQTSWGCGVEYGSVIALGLATLLIGTWIICSRRVV